MSENSNDVLKGLWVAEWKAFAFFFIMELLMTPRYTHIIWDEVNPYSPIIIPALTLCYLLLNCKVYSYFIDRQPWNVPNLAILSICQLAVLTAALSYCSWDFTGKNTSFMGVTRISGKIIVAWHTFKVGISTINLCYKVLTDPSQE